MQYLDPTALPGDHGIHGGDVAGYEVDLGAILEDELPRVERPLQLGAKRSSSHHDVGHAVLKHRVLVLPGVLCSVERDVGLAKDGAGVGLDGISHTDTHRHFDRVVGLRNPDRFIHDVENPSCDGIDAAFQSFALDEDYEFIAAQSSYGVSATDNGQQPPAELGEHEVSGAVAECVVDVLEIVDVHEDHCRSSGGPLRTGEEVFESVTDERAVREPGQRIVEREVVKVGGPFSDERERLISSARQ